MTMDVSAIVTRSGDWWAVEVPEVPGLFTQARRLSEVEAMVRDGVAMLTEIPTDSVSVSVEIPTDSVSVSVEIRLPEEAKAHAERSHLLRAVAEKAAREATEEAAAAAHVLAEEGMSMREIGYALGVSHQHPVGAWARRTDVRLHKRESQVRKAHLDLSNHSFKVRDEADLTDIEYLQWLASEQQSVLKFMLREERHGDSGMAAGLAYDDEED